MGKYRPPMMRDRQQSPAVEALKRELHLATFSLGMCWIFTMPVLIDRSIASASSHQEHLSCSEGMQVLKYYSSRQSARRVPRPFQACGKQR